MYDSENVLIEKKPLYVTMTDSFMSNWPGGRTKNKKNKLIFGCDNQLEADTVYAFAIRRSEMKYVNIVLNIPKYDFNHEYVQYRNKDMCPVWYGIKN